MYDYVSYAQNEGILIKNDMYDKTIKNYSVDEEDKTITVFYMSGREEYYPLTEENIKKIKKEQEEDFNNIKNKVLVQTNIFTGLKIIFVSTDAVIATTALMSGMTLQGIGFILMGTSLLLKGKTFYKIKKEMKLVSWVLEHKEQVDEMIKEEVKENMHWIKDYDNTSNNPTPIYEYPYGDVLYSKEIYENGIDINNMSDFAIGELEHIKNKVKQRQKKIINKKRSV